MGTQLRANLKFNANQAIQMRIEQLAADPGFLAAEQGRLIHNTTSDRVKYADATTYRALIASGLIVVNDFAANIADTDGTLAANLDTRLSTQRAVRTYVDSSVGLSDFWLDQGDIDASTNPNFPAAEKGHAYLITVAGLIGGAAGQAVVPGDLIVSRIDANPAGTDAVVGANWMVRKVPVVAPAASETVSGIAEIATQAEVDGLLDDVRVVTPLKLASAIGTQGTALVNTLVPAATELVAGKAEIATAAEVTAGTDDTRFVTPLKLAGALAAAGGSFVQAITASAGATITAATHGLGALVKLVQVYEGTTLVGVDVDVNAAGDVTWSSSTALTGSIIIGN